MTGHPGTVSRVVTPTPQGTLYAIWCLASRPTVGDRTEAGTLDLIARLAKSALDRQAVS